MKELELRAAKIRKKTLEIIYLAKSGHTGGSLSCIEILTVLYFHVMNIDPKNPKKDDRDRFVMSKGHSVEALYTTLASAGFFEDSLLDTYGSFKSPLAGHPINKIPGIELNTGALGHGLSFGVGVSLAAKMDKKTFHTYVLMGDGELDEGSVYEAAMAASHYRLDNLVAIIDRNRLQISGRTEDVMTLEPLKPRWEAFGWQVFEVNGNNIEDLIKMFDSLDYTNKKPKLIIARTTKGYGVSFIEGVAKWHHGVPDEEQFKIAMAEIDEQIQKLEGS
ncbi:MAG: transketolase [Candidatus Marinimicrobia bacterium]|nr:transketolase [Candidatus Neomarinimicrobiota bacterium]